MSNIKLFALNKFETSEKDSIAVVSGYIPYFDPNDKGTEYQINDKFKIRFAKGAFDNAINSGATIDAFYNHESSTIYASTRNGTLKFTPFENFLRYQATLDLSDSDAAKVYSKVKSGLVTGTSFGGTVVNETWDDDENDEYAINTITEFAMNEVSVTPVPAFQSSRAVLRAGADVFVASWQAHESRLMSERVAALKI